MVSMAFIIGTLSFEAMKAAAKAADLDLPWAQWITTEWPKIDRLQVNYLLKSSNIEGSAISRNGGCCLDSIVI